MKTIYRYSLSDPLQIKNGIKVPGLIENGVRVKFKDQVLKVDIIRGIPSIWCMVDTEVSEELHHFKIVGTGWPLEEKKRDYLGSFIYDDFGEIYHVFLAN